MGEMDKNQIAKQKTDWFILGGLILLGIYLTTILSTFSPIYRYNFGPDEICYRIVSLGWLQGKIPYRDLFDHKGPLTYLVYALGFLISGKANWGVWVIFSCITCGIFVLIYKSMRVFRETKPSLIGTLLLLSLFFLKKDPLFSSASQPDHIILLLLMIQEYLVLRCLKRYKETKASEESTSTPMPFQTRDMFISGLLCGAVFMIKMNVCFYYFFFFGAYFIWLLTRKALSSFLSSCGAFVGGILLVSAPFFIYFKAVNAFSEFIQCYFTFNREYAKRGKLMLHFSRLWIDPYNQLTILLLFILMAIAAVVLLREKDHRLHHVICISIGAMIYFSLTLIEVFAYSFCYIIPLYCLALGYIAGKLSSLVRGKLLLVLITVTFIIVLVNLSLSQLINEPPVSREKRDYEIAMEKYYQAHPDATCLFFDNLCEKIFYDLSPAIPDFRYFYAPRERSNEMTSEQIQYIQMQKPDVIALFSLDDPDSDYIQSATAFFDMNGYTLYYDDHQVSQYYVYVRKE